MTKWNKVYIEEELEEIILPALKKIQFKSDKIKFITYLFDLFEGFRGGNSAVLVDYNAKYNQRQLTEEEKEAVNELLKIIKIVNFIMMYLLIFKM